MNACCIFQSQTELLSKEIEKPFLKVFEFMTPNLWGMLAWLLAYWWLILVLWVRTTPVPCLVFFPWTKQWNHIVTLCSCENEYLAIKSHFLWVRKHCIQKSTKLHCLMSSVCCWKLNVYGINLVKTQCTWLESPWKCIQYISHLTFNHSEQIRIIRLCMASVI